jgi:Peptidase family M28
MGRRIFRTVTLVALSMMAASCGGRKGKDREGLARLRRHVSALATEIGPRPVGTSGDRKAQEYVRRQMAAAGLQVREQVFDRVAVSPQAEVRAESANVVGTLTGRGEGAILVGSHHDSRNAQCPGASDDASGVAVMLEAARILAGRPHRKTLIFASFGGEETFGLPGSRAFVKSWTGPPIRLAITLDFVGSGRIFVAPFPSPPALWANRMLARAERRALTDRVSFDPWLVIVPKLIPIHFSADHVSFLEAGVPALNLSCQFPAWTYHTPQDREARIEWSSVLAARDLVVRMVEDADAREPAVSGASRGYVPLVFFGVPLFIEDPVLILVPVLTALLGLATLGRFRRDLATLRGLAESLRGVIVALPLVAVAVSGPFISTGILGRISGARHPGFTHPGASLAGALLAAAFSLWLSLFLARFLRPGNSPGAYLAPAVVLEGGLGAVCLALGRADVAFPFAIGAGAMLLAAWSRHAARRLALGLLGMVPLVPFLSPTTYRMFLELSGVTVPAHALEIAAGILFLPWFLFLQHLTCLPESLYARPGGHFFRPVTGLILALLAVGGTWAGAMRPPYDSSHQVLVSVKEEIELARRRAHVSLSSLESLRPIRLGSPASKLFPDALEADLRVPFPSLDLPGLDLAAESDGEGGIWIRIRGEPPGEPRWIGLRFGGGRGLEVERDGSWNRVGQYRIVIFPHDGLSEQLLHLRKAGSDQLTVEGTISYDSDLLNLRPQGPFRTFRIECRVHFQKKLA